MSNRLLAVMVMTHNHPETVKYILEQNIAIYKKYGIDLYICDDGKDNQTKNITEEFISEGYDNLFWVDAHGVEDGDAKYLKAIKQEYTLKEYKYLFPIKDRATFSERIIESISEEVKKDFDLIMVVNDFERWELKLPPIKDCYDDPTSFFSHYGQLTTNWRSMIFNSETMLNPDNLAEFEEKYHLGAHFEFTQTVVTFSSLAKLSNPKIRVIRAFYQGDANENADFGAGSAWLNVVFELWIDKWTKAIFGLPEIYNQYKASVLKAETNLGVLFGSVDGLLAHKGRGVLTKEKFEKYRSMWSMISDVPVEWVDLILNEQYETLFTRVYTTLEEYLLNGEYEKAYYTVLQNKWLEEVKGDFKKVNYIMFLYKLDCYSQGSSNRLNGVKKLQDIVEMAETN